MIFPRSVCILLVVCIAQVQAEVIQVKNAEEFQALPVLKAGDEVILKDGNYGSIEKILQCNIADDALAQQRPAVVRAETPGGVKVVKPCRLTLQGKGLVLAGFDFAEGSGMLDNGKNDPAWMIKLAADSRQMKLNNLRFSHCVAGDDYGHWVFVEGFQHTIEFCTFEGKDEPIRNATVAFKRNTSEASVSVPRLHRLHHCYFGPRHCAAGSGKTANGYEAIRIGDSGSQAHDMQVTVDQNVFYRAVWRNDDRKPNDTEIISNKSRGNRYLHNTFLESFGQLTLRHGDACLVEGNFIFGAGYYAGNTIQLRPANSQQGGIRVIGQDHTVRNNYLTNLAGSELRAALCVMSGSPNFRDGDGDGGNNGYESAHGAQILHNTFLNCREINLGHIDSGNQLPQKVVFANNVVQLAEKAKGLVVQEKLQLAASGGNYVYQPQGRFGWQGLNNSTYSSTDSPQLTVSHAQFMIPTVASPLLNHAWEVHSAAEDIRGLSRPLQQRDIGCFELETNGAGHRPLLRHEVGPLFDGGPADTYPKRVEKVEP